MKDGIYHVSFSSKSQEVGQGIVVFKENSANGGDYGYTYSGTFSSEGEQIKSILTIKQWNASAVSIFGPLKEFSLELNGSFSFDNSFLAHGHISGHSSAQITIRGKRISNVS